MVLRGASHTRRLLRSRLAFLLVSTLARDAPAPRTRGRRDAGADARRTAARAVD
jgi:hypothetical protein